MELPFLFHGYVYKIQECYRAELYLTSGIYGLEVCPERDRDASGTRIRYALCIFPKIWNVPQQMKRRINTGILALMILCMYSSFAQHTVVLRNGQYDIVLSPHAYVYTGSAGHAAIDKPLQSDSTKFVRNNGPEEINYGIDQPRGWCKFFIRNESSLHDWVLKIQQSRVDTAQLYIVRENNVIEKFPMTGHFKAFRERPVHSLPLAYSIPIKKNETIAFYLYTARQYGRHAAILNLQAKDYFESYEYGFNVVLFFVCGMVALASLMGLFLFLFVRQRLYIYYSIYAMSFFFVLLGDTGFAHAALFFPHDQTVADGFTMIFYYWMGGCLGVFTIELLHLRVHARRWIYWFGITLSYTLCFFALLLLIPGLPHLIRWSLVSSSYYLAVITNLYILYIISISIHKKKEPVVYFYMAGFFFTSFVALLLTFSDFQIINFPLQNKDFYYLTPFVEILFVALGIGIHFSKTLKERINVQLALNQTQDQIITIQEDERRRIAQDLHDDVNNSLAAIRNMVIRKDEPARIEKEIDHLIDRVRTISHDLMPLEFDELSLNEAIEHTVDKFQDHPSLALAFNYTGKVMPLKPFYELVIYRIISELITNVLKHAQATQALIQLMYQADSLIVTVEDNGTGMKNSNAEEGIGLRSIRRRADYIHAQLKIESDDKGTLTILEVPYESH
jgi:signal transduction histidine kinase